ncbi:MAG: TetR/AcrR family transcriptional regulator [Pseudorhodoplanes sp.]
MANNATLTRWEPTAKWETRYREVRDAAARSFAEKGYLGASLKDIADRLGIRAASLYYYLPSKDAALAAVCEHGITSFIGNLRNIIESNQPAVEKVRAVIANQLSPLRKDPDGDYIRVFLRHRHELSELARKRMVALAREFQLLVENVFAEGVAKGEFRRELNPQLAMLALLGLCNSVIGARSMPRAVTIDNLIEEYSEIFIDGIFKTNKADRKAKLSSSRKTATRKA